MPNSPPILSYAPKPVRTIRALRCLLCWQIVNWLLAAAFGLITACYSILAFLFVGRGILPLDALLMIAVPAVITAFFVWFAMQCRLCRRRIAQDDPSGAHRALVLTWIVEASTICLATGIPAYALYHHVRHPHGLDDTIWWCGISFIPITILAVLLGVSLGVLSRAKQSLEHRANASAPNAHTPR